MEIWQQPLKGRLGNNEYQQDGEWPGMRKKGE